MVFGSSRRTTVDGLLPPTYVVRGKVLFSQVSVCSHLGGVPPFRGGGYPPSKMGSTYLGRWGTYLGRVVPTLAGGYLPWWGVPTLVGVPTFPACACYAAGSMPLAFRQEDFLVIFIITKHDILLSIPKYVLS